MPVIEKDSFETSIDSVNSDKMAKNRVREERYQKQKARHQKQKQKQEKALRDIVTFIEKVDSEAKNPKTVVQYKVRKHKREIPGLIKFKSVSVHRNEPNKNDESEIGNLLRDKQKNMRMRMENYTDQINPFKTLSQGQSMTALRKGEILPIVLTSSYSWIPSIPKTASRS